jgi:hypothetical protein
MKTRLPLGLGTALVAAAALSVACGGSNEATPADGGDAQEGAPAIAGLAPDGTSAKGADAQNTARTAEGALAGGGTSSTQAQPSGGSGGGGAPSGIGTLDRKIVFSATLNLSAKDVGASFNAVSRVATAAGGFVEKSSFNGNAAEAKRGATLTLRVPVDQYQGVLGDLRSLDGVTVAGESSRSSEVTEQYTDLQSRLRNLERTEQQYLKLLEQAKSIPDILTMTDRLDNIRAQIEQIQGRIKVLDALTEMATVDVTLSPVLPGKTAPDSDGPKSVGAAFADAWEWSLDAGRYLGAAGAVLLVGAIWLIVPLGLAALGMRMARRRRGPSTPA